MNNNKKAGTKNQNCKECGLDLTDESRPIQEGGFCVSCLIYLEQ